MRLTAFLWRKKMPNGHIWRGKHRLYWCVTEKEKQTLRDEYEVEERNMYLLRHPFLTLEQSNGHAQALGKPEKWKSMWMEAKLRFKEPVRLEERLGHLRVKEAWD